MGDEFDPYEVDKKQTKAFYAGFLVMMVIMGLVFTILLFLI